jgi:hypothetical protein
MTNILPGARALAALSVFRLSFLTVGIYDNCDAARAESSAVSGGGSGR